MDLYYSYQLHKESIPEELRLSEEYLGETIKAYRDKMRNHYQVKVLKECLNKIYPDSNKFRLL